MTEGGDESGETTEEKKLHPPFWTDEDFTILETPVEELNPDQYFDYTRARTVKLWQECQAAKKAKLDAGASEVQAHEAAKALWNEWADKQLAERKRLEEAGGEFKWRLGYSSLSDWIKAHSSEIRLFLLDSLSNFSSLTLLLANVAEGQCIEVDSDTPNKSDKSIQYEGELINLSNFKFPAICEALDTKFTGPAYFRSAQFTGDASFSSTQFTGDAYFRSAQFTGDASFRSAQFTGDAYFRSAQFTGDASFSSTQFTGPASFRSAQFTGPASFSSAQFTGPASFRNAQFTGPASFRSAQFTGPASFRSAQFMGDASFRSAQFTGSASFRSAQFTGPASFRSAQFTGDASFRSAQFTGDTSFSSTMFSKQASFGLAKFKDATNFSSARFTSDQHVADFHAIISEVSFSLKDAWFRRVPDFMESDFKITPRLDDVRIEDTLCCPEHMGNDDFSCAETKEADPREGFWLKTRFKRAPDRNAHARYRRLKQLADEGHNHVNALHFFAQEMRARRFWVDKPTAALATQHHQTQLAKEIEKKTKEIKDEGEKQTAIETIKANFPTKPDANWAQFWFGLAFEKLSDFGQSVMRPLSLWFGYLILSAFVYYLAAPTKYEIEQSKETFGKVYQNACWPPKRWPILESSQSRYTFENSIFTIGFLISGCKTCVPMENESENQLDNPMSVGLSAFQLSLRNAFVFLPVTDAAQTKNANHCFYGSKIKTKSGAELTTTPHLFLRIWGFLQTFFSFILLFLIGLALRNRFKIG